MLDRHKVALLSWLLTGKFPLSEDWELRRNKALADNCSEPWLSDFQDTRNPSSSLSCCYPSESQLPGSGMPFSI